MIVWLLDLQLPMQSVYITTSIVSSSPAHVEVYSIQHYVIKFVGDLWQTGRWFSSGTPVSSTNKIGRHDITEILLKVALNTTTLTPHSSFVLKSFETNNSFKYGCRSYFSFNFLIFIYFLVIFEVVYL